MSRVAEDRWWYSSCNTSRIRQSNWKAGRMTTGKAAWCSSHGIFRSDMCAICLRRLKRWLDLFPIPACDFRLPGRNAPLDPPDQPIEADGHQHQDDDRDEHGRRIEIVGGIDNDGAEAGNRREEFGNDHCHDR